MSHRLFLTGEFRYKVKAHGGRQETDRQTGGDAVPCSPCMLTQYSQVLMHAARSSSAEEDYWKTQFILVYPCLV